MEKVKLIIELDEKKYNYIKKYGTVPMFYDHTIANAVLDGKLLQTELEDIKVETLKLFCDACVGVQSCHKTDSACYHQCAFEKALEDMINNRISKLKGEQE